MNDKHAERRDAKWRKERHGMKVSNRGILLLAEIIRNRALAEEQRLREARCEGCKQCNWGEIVPCPSQTPKKVVTTK